MKRFLLIAYLLFDIIFVIIYCYPLFAVLSKNDSISLWIFLSMTVPIICCFIFWNIYFFKTYLNHVIKIGCETDKIIIYYKNRKKEIYIKDITLFKKSKFRQKIFLNYRENGKFKTIVFFDSYVSPFKTKNFDYDLINNFILNND